MMKLQESTELTEARNVLTEAIQPVQAMVKDFKEKEAEVFTLLDNRKDVEEALQQQLEDTKAAKASLTDETALMTLITEERSLSDQLMTAKQVTETVSNTHKDNLGNSLAEIFTEHDKLLLPLSQYVAEITLEMSQRTITQYQEEVSAFELEINLIHNIAYAALAEHDLYKPTQSGGPRYKGVYVERAGKITQLSFGGQY